MTRDDGQPGRPSEGLSRRNLLRAAGAGGLALAAAPVLAACGSPSSSGAGGAGGTGGASASELLSILGISKSEAAGGISVPLGAVLPLTGPGSFYGKVQGNGLKLWPRSGPPAVPASRSTSRTTSPVTRRPA